MRKTLLILILNYLGIFVSYPLAHCLSYKNVICSLARLHAFMLFILETLTFGYLDSGNNFNLFKIIYKFRRVIIVLCRLNSQSGGIINSCVCCMAAIIHVRIDSNENESQHRLLICWPVWGLAEINRRFRAWLPGKQFRVEYIFTR